MTKDTASSDVGKTKAPQPLETNEATNAPATNKVTGSAEPPPGLSNRLQSRATSLPANDLLYLQRTIGNRAVNDLLQRQERPPQAAPSIPYAEGGQVSSDLEQRIRYTQAGGSALPTHTQRQLEPVVGADLRNVKVHTDLNAVQLNRELGAKAFTVGKHIYYGAGQSPSDVQLTAHEAVHTVQQGASPRVQRDYVDTTNPPVTISDSEDEIEDQDTDQETEDSLDTSSPRLGRGYFQGNGTGNTINSTSSPRQSRRFSRDSFSLDTSVNDFGGTTSSTPSTLPRNYTDANPSPLPRNYIDSNAPPLRTRSETTESLPNTSVPVYTDGNSTNEPSTRSPYTYTDPNAPPRPKSKGKKVSGGSSWKLWKRIKKKKDTKPSVTTPSTEQTTSEDGIDPYFRGRTQSTNTGETDEGTPYMTTRAQGRGVTEWGVREGRGKEDRKKRKQKSEKSGNDKKPEQDVEPLLPDFEDRTLHRFDPDEYVFTVGVRRGVEDDYAFAKARTAIVFRNELRRIARDAWGIGKLLRHVVREPKENEDIKLKAARQVIREKGLSKAGTPAKDDSKNDGVELPKVPEEIETKNEVTEDPNNLGGTQSLNTESLNTGSLSEESNESDETQIDPAEAEAVDLARQSADVGHSWVELTTHHQGRLKTLYSFGMMPGGLKHPDRTPDGTGLGAPQYLDYKISAKAYNKAFKLASKYYYEQPQYDVRDFNCTKFAQVIAKAASVSFPAKAIVVPFYPKKGLSGLRHKAFMPGGLIEGMKGLKNVRNTGTKEERFISEEEKQQEKLYTKTMKQLKSQPKQITGTGRFKNLKSLEPEYVAGESKQEKVSINGKEIGPKSYWRQRANDSMGNLPVKYLSDIELEQYELTFGKEDNLFYWRGKVAHTEKMSQIGGWSNATGRAIFVMTEDGKIYMADQGDEVNLSKEQKKNPQWLFHHSSFLHGKPVASAGELIFVNGKLTGVTDASGHYKPGLSFTRQILQRFADEHIDLSGVKVTLVEKSKGMPEITVDAQDLLDFDSDDESDFRRQGLLKGSFELIRDGKADEAYAALQKVLSEHGSALNATSMLEVGLKFEAGGAFKFAAIWMIHAYMTDKKVAPYTELARTAKSLVAQSDYFEGGRVMQWLYARTKDVSYALEAAEAALKEENAYKTADFWASIVVSDSTNGSLVQRAKGIRGSYNNFQLNGSREDLLDHVPEDGVSLLKPGNYGRGNDMF